MKKVIHFLVLFFVCASISHAQQDKHYSMFFASPSQLNAGAAGHFEGDVQLFTNFRSQWFSISQNPFRSFSGSVDGRLFEERLYGSFIGAGMNIYNDQSGDGQFRVNIISFPVNYSIQLNKTSHLALGIQPAYYSQTFNESTLYFDSQWQGDGFNTAVSSGENLGILNVNKFDLSSGLYYSNKPKKNLSYKFGVAGNHLTKQRIGFYSLNEKLYRNVTLFGQLDYSRPNSLLTFHPAIFAFFQGPNRELTFGSNFEFQLKPPSIHTMYFDGQSISIGTYYRTGDAFIANLIYNAGSLSVGIGYDMNLSGLTVASNGKGAFEMFLSFKPEFRRGFGSPRIN